MSGSGILLLIATCIFLGIVPALIGRFVKSGGLGLAILSIVPILLVIGGILGWDDARNSSNEETADWADIWLVFSVLGVILAVVGVIGFGIGRFWRSKQLAAGGPSSRTEELRLQPPVDAALPEGNVVDQPPTRTLSEVPW